VAKVRGQAGTDWRTELCTGNLSNRGIRITVVAGNDSTLDLRTLVNRGSDDTVCHDDVIADLFNRSSFNRWLLTAAYPDDGICRMPIQMDLYGKDHVIGDLLLRCTPSQQFVAVRMAAVG